jgi:hypothetical protein
MGCGRGIQGEEIEVAGIDKAPAIISSWLRLPALL